MYQRLATWIVYSRKSRTIKASSISYSPMLVPQDTLLWATTYSNRQIEEVLVDFCLNHFNVFNRKGPERMLLAGSLPLALALLSLINPSVSPKIFIDSIYDVRHE